MELQSLVSRIVRGATEHADKHNASHPQLLLINRTELADLLRGHLGDVVGRCEVVNRELPGYTAYVRATVAAGNLAPMDFDEYLANLVTQRMCHAS